MSDPVDAELLRKLETAVANLPHVQRLVFVAHRLDGFSYKDVAWLTGLSERQVERQLAKAICKLAKQLDGQGLSWWERLL